MLVLPVLKYGTTVVCVFLCSMYRHWFNNQIRPRARVTKLGVTYLPDPSPLAQTLAVPLPPGLALLGAPVSIGALVKLGSLVSYQDRDSSSRPPGTGLHVPLWMLEKDFLGLFIRA